MALFSRFTQKLFGGSAGANRIAAFGSLTAGVPQAYSGASATPSLIQALSNFSTGLDGSLVAGSTTAIQDFNALHFLATYQLAYLFQAGLAEYDAGTTYEVGSLCQVAGIIYRSKVATNIGNTPASSPTQWENYFAVSFSSAFTAPTITKKTSGSGTYTTPAGCKYLRITAVGGGGGSGVNGGGAGGAGGNTTFGGTVIVAGGGGGGTTSGAGGAGGTASIGAGAIGQAFTGGAGTAGCGTFSNYTSNGAPGGNSILGGGGGGGKNGVVAGGTAGATNTGGGGGADGGAESSTYQGQSGGAGGGVIAIVNSPSATYAYAVGAGGTSSGAAGGSGVLLIEEYYC